MTVLIRRAGPEDAGGIGRLLAVQLAEHHVTIPEARLAAAIAGAIDVPRRGFFLVAEDDGACVGVAYVSLVWALEHGGQSAWLEELYVVPARRGSGLGARLLEAVLAAARGAGCAAVDLEIEPDHEQVRSLYERHGFTALSRRRLARRLDPP